MLDPMQLAQVTIAGALATGIVAWGVRTRVRNRRHRRAWDRGEGARVGQPDTLHPRVDQHRCICTGACITACPEKDVLGFIDGKLKLLDAGRCVGHADCLRSCPVEALSLVIGSAERGVDLPVLGSDFSTSAPGVYVAGELGGMGLIHNAVNQGVQAMQAIAASLAGAARIAADPLLDVVIIGAGPAGLAAGLEAKARGLRAALLERNEPGGAVRAYPRQKIVMTSPATLPLYGKVKLSRTTKEALLELWDEVIAKTGLVVECGVTAEGGTLEPDGTWTLRTSAGTRRTRKVLLAIGRRGTPRKLGVPGEALAKVTYALTDPAQYRGKHCLVVGAGDSALEAALALASQPDTTVTLSHQGPRIDRARAQNRELVEAAVQAGTLAVRASSNVAKIDENAVTLGDGAELPNDYVIVCIGGTLPTAYLASFGIDVRTMRGEVLLRP